MAKIWLTISAAARRLVMSESNVRVLENEGKLTAIRDSSGRRLFDAATVERFATQRAERAAKGQREE